MQSLYHNVCLQRGCRPDEMQTTARHRLTALLPLRFFRGVDALDVVEHEVGLTHPVLLAVPFFAFFAFRAVYSSSRA